MGMGQGKMDDSGPMAEINITPFVDVMLVLLIIFMVAAPLLESGIPLQLPKASSKALPKSDETPVTLSIKEDSRIYLNKDEISFKELKSKIETFYRNRKKKEVFIRAAGQLPYEYVARAMAIVKSAGVDKIGLVTLPPEETSTK